MVGMMYTFLDLEHMFYYNLLHVCFSLVATLSTGGKGD